MARTVIAVPLAVRIRKQIHRSLQPLFQLGLAIDDFLACLPLRQRRQDGVAHRVRADLHAGLM